ncbi:hypothetical protein WJX79_007349 [Trebouxia sp. C0005]
MYNSQATPGYGPGYSQTGRPNTSGGFNTSSALMGLAAGAIGGAVLDHMVTGHHHHNQGGYGGGGMMPMGGMGMGGGGGGHHHHHHHH